MIKGFVARFSRTINKLKDPIAIANKVIKRSEVTPNSDPLVIKIFKVRSIMTKRTRPLMSNLFRENPFRFSFRCAFNKKQRN